MWAYIILLIVSKLFLWSKAPSLLGLLDIPEEKFSIGIENHSHLVI
ncbi:hypothetical protein VPH184E373B_0156 [Vibrio phage 184E37-3b]|nr:hypothetical protein MYOV056v2_p0137 [Vibrio phage 184E37.3a]QZI89917.1 hypothetical protein MYOV057v1_p0002 [Vibrio phage 184E37.1]